MIRARLLGLVLLTALLGGCCKAMVLTDSSSPRVLREFDARLTVAAKHTDIITESASKAAERVAANPTALLSVPYAPQNSFAEELLNRAGGLANALPPEERPKLVTPNDVLIMSARCWEEDADRVRGMIKQWGQPGVMTVLFASKAGMPEDIKVDYVICNGAKTGGKAEASMNSITNITQAWMWCCEYAAALTHKGKYPGVLLSIFMEGSAENNKRFQGSPDGRRFLGDIREVIPTGSLSQAYLIRVYGVVRDLNDPKNVAAIDHAADLCAAKIGAGGQVAVSTCTHFLLGEISMSKRTPIKPFQSVWHTKNGVFSSNVKEGDVLIWMGYIGLSTPYEDYATPMKKSGATLVTSFVTDKANPSNNDVKPAVHIEQHWQPPDAEVKVPFAPGVMAPVSGIDQALIYRMIEDAVASRLDASGRSAK